MYEFWSNRFALILSILAIIGYLILGFKNIQRIDKKIDFEFISLNDDRLYIAFLNSMEKNFYLSRNEGVFYINNLTKSKIDTVYIKMMFEDLDHGLILGKSDILQSEFRQKNTIPSISLDAASNYEIICNLQFFLKVTSKKEIIKRVYFNVKKTDMQNILEILHIGSGS